MSLLQSQLSNFLKMLVFFFFLKYQNQDLRFDNYFCPSFTIWSLCLCLHESLLNVQFCGVQTDYSCHVCCSNWGEGSLSHYALYNAEHIFWIKKNKTYIRSKTYIFSCWSKNLKYLMLNHPSLYRLRSIFISVHLYLVYKCLNFQMGNHPPKTPVV